MSPRVVILERSEESRGATSLEDDTAERSIYKALAVATYYGVRYCMLGVFKVYLIHRV